MQDGSYFCKKFSFVTQHKLGQQNRVVEALSRETHLLSVLKTEIIGFVVLRDEYESDHDNFSTPHYFFHL